MNFRVESTGLRSARESLTALAADTSVANTYRNTHLNIAGADNGVFFTHIDNVNEDVKARVGEVISKLDSILETSGLELGAAAKWYDDTDSSRSKLLDAQVPKDADLPADGRFTQDQDFEDTVPEDPGNYEPDDNPVPPDDDSVIMAPGPIGAPEPELPMA